MADQPTFEDRARAVAEATGTDYDTAAEALRRNDEEYAAWERAGRPARPPWRGDLAGLREAVHDAIERVVENEISGVPHWRSGLTDRLTNAVLVALPASPEDGLREALTRAIEKYADELCASGGMTRAAIIRTIVLAALKENK